MNPHPTAPPAAPPVAPPIAVDIVVPVYNEERVLTGSIRALADFLATEFPFTARVTIADNASTDSTWALATALATELPNVRAVHLDEKGRGRALNQVWSASDADVLAYMDVDLSTDLAALLPLVAPLLSGHSDVAIGTRLASSSRVTRGSKREFISRCYNLIVRTTLSAGFSDAQCGFKAVRADRARALLPLVEDTGWFFDTELLVLAERAGLRIHEVPVDWVDDPESSVDLVATAIADLRGIVRLLRGFSTGRLPLAALSGPQTAEAERRVGAPSGLLPQMSTFAVIGVVSTLAYLALYWLLRGQVSAQAANALALLITAIGNTAANRRFTFGVAGRQRRLRHHGQGLAVFAVGLTVTAASLWALHTYDPDASRGFEVAVLVVANITATLIRFVLLRGWVFRRHTGGSR